MGKHDVGMHDVAASGGSNPYGRYPAAPSAKRDMEFSIADDTVRADGTAHTAAQRPDAAAPRPDTAHTAASHTGTSRADAAYADTTYADVAGNSNRRGKGKGKGKKKGDRTSKVLVIIGSVLLGVALIGLGLIGYQYWKGNSTYTKAANNVTVADEQSAASYAIDVDWASLQAVNPEIVAWVQIPGTNINYPVAKHADNEFYLSHTYTQEYGIVGCIFLDYASASDFSDVNSIIYGHNMDDQSMFYDLTNYIDAAYLADRPYIYLATPDGKTHRLKIVSVIVASGTEELRQTAFPTLADFTTYVQTALSRTVVPVDGVDASQIKHLYTFATCSYQFNDARTIVYAAEIDEYGTFVGSTEYERLHAEAGSAAASTTSATATGSTATSVAATGSAAATGSTATSAVATGSTVVSAVTGSVAASAAPTDVAAA